MTVPRFDVEAERIDVFRVDDEYLSTRFFDRTDLFEYRGDDLYEGVPRSRLRQQVRNEIDLASVPLLASSVRHY